MIVKVSQAYRFCLCGVIMMMISESVFVLLRGFLSVEWKTDITINAIELASSFASEGWEVLRDFLMYCELNLSTRSRGTRIIK